MTTQRNLRAKARDPITGLAQESNPPELLALCLAAVQTVDENRLRAAAPATTPLRPQMLLTLLTYSYVNGHYDSRDIVAAVGSDRTLRYICAGTRPLWTDLRRFRRHHRDLVAQCLTWVLRQVWAPKPDRSDEAAHGGEGGDAGPDALLVSEVGMRLGAAALLDGADSD